MQVPRTLRLPGGRAGYRRPRGYRNSSEDDVTSEEKRLRAGPSPPQRASTPAPRISPVERYVQPPRSPTASPVRADTSRSTPHSVSRTPSRGSSPRPIEGGSDVYYPPTHRTNSTTPTSYEALQSPQRSYAATSTAPSSPPPQRDPEVEQTEAAPALHRTTEQHQRSYPPIVVESLRNWPHHFRSLYVKLGHAPNARPYKTGVRFIARTPEEYRVVQRHLTEAAESDPGLQWFSYSLSSELPTKVAIRGLPAATDPADIKQALEELGFEAQHVRPIPPKRGRSGCLYHAQLARLNRQELSRLYAVTELLHMPGVVIEAWRGRSGPAQCHRCQAFGHSSAGCHRPPRCVRCGEGPAPAPGPEQAGTRPPPKAPRPSGPEAPGVAQTPAPPACGQEGRTAPPPEHPAGRRRRKRRARRGTSADGPGDAAALPLPPPAATAPRSRAPTPHPGATPGGARAGAVEREWGLAPAPAGGAARGVPTPAAGPPPERERTAQRQDPRLLARALPPAPRPAPRPAPQAEAEEWPPLPPPERVAPRAAPPAEAEEWPPLPPPEHLADPTSFVCQATDTIVQVLSDLAYGEEDLRETAQRNLALLRQRFNLE
ncbi:uncharacterized protein LOC135086417 [Ostrinia nubilalis]|uniref:uncharacterized protein LOC135086417 n=1 Tax=Ostrinia nubilalis TaxID=29057 RepID=UPI0030822E33